MLDDSLFREFQAMPYEEQLERSAESVELREILLMSEIFRCGMEIFGGEEEKEQGVGRKDRDEQYGASSQRKYVYEYDYKRPQEGIPKPLQPAFTPITTGIAPNKSQHTSLLQYSADDISFTLSSEQNPTRQKDTNRSINSITNSINQPTNPHISWKNHLVEKVDNLEDYLSKKYLISETLSGKDQPLVGENEKVGKWKKPVHSKSRIMHDSKQLRAKSRKRSKESSLQQIENQSPIKNKDNLYKKTFDLSNHKISYFPQTTVKKRKAIFQQRTSQQRATPHNNLHLNYSSSYYPQQKPPLYLTPQKNTPTRPPIPLSEQITKNIYGRLKQQVTGTSFIKEFEIQQRKTQEQSQKIWRDFIDRSDNWMEKKKTNLIEKQARERYQMDCLAQTRRREQQSPTKQQQQYYSYADIRHQPQKQVSHQMMRFEDKKFQPEYTFRLKSNNKRSPQKFPQKKKQSSVQNCINKLKTQTQLLKVKLLSPLKNQIEDDEMLNHYKQLNESESKRLVRRFNSRQDVNKGYDLSRVLRGREGVGQLKTLYGDCIGDQGKR